jgi:hypothetical protein
LQAFLCALHSSTAVLLCRPVLLCRWRHVPLTLKVLELVVEKRHVPLTLDALARRVSCGCNGVPRQISTARILEQFPRTIEKLWVTFPAGILDC